MTAARPAPPRHPGAAAGARAPRSCCGSPGAAIRVPIAPSARHYDLRHRIQIVAARWATHCVQAPPSISVRRHLGSALVCGSRQNLMRCSNDLRPRHLGVVRADVLPRVVRTALRRRAASRSRPRPRRDHLPGRRCPDSRSRTMSASTSPSVQTSGSSAQNTSTKRVRKLKWVSRLLKYVQTARSASTM